MSRQLALGVGAGVTAFAAVVASAANLGGVSTDDLGAETTVVAGCDTDGIDISYTTSFSSEEYRIATVTLDDVDEACDGQEVAITLFDSSGDSLEEVSGTVTDPDLLTTAPFEQAFAFVDSIKAEDVEGAAVVISG